MQRRKFQKLYSDVKRVQPIPADLLIAFTIGSSVSNMLTTLAYNNCCKNWNEFYFLDCFNQVSGTCFLPEGGQGVPSPKACCRPKIRIFLAESQERWLVTVLFAQRMCCFLSLQWLTRGINLESIGNILPFYHFRLDYSKFWQIKIPLL